ncbi:MAG: hypothetical protein PHY23_06245, partial [Oscillospiraceae bacterium]|nr:hypothetical protein [Oscillospiraceae bacterium]
VAADHIPLARHLGLTASQSYLICDDQLNRLLIVTYDTEKQNPSEGGRDQANTTYYYDFIQYDLNTQSVLKTFPIRQFGICPSACFAFDGFLYAYMTKTESETWDTALFYQPTDGAQEKQRIEVSSPALSPLGAGPVLSRCGDSVVLGYSTETQAQGIASSAFQILRSDLAVSPLLSFLWDAREDEEWITDDFRTSDTHLAYPVGRDGQVVFYVGQPGQEPTQISLPKGEKLHAFAITDDELLVSRTNQSAGGSFCIERLDLTGKSLEVYETREPMNDIRVNGDLFCVFGAQTPLGVFTVTDGAIKPVPVDTTFLASTWNFALPNGTGFVLASHLPEEYPEIWRISVNKAPA